MKTVNPYFNFAGNTEEAFEYYQSVFGGEFLGVVRFRDFPGNPMQIPEGDLDKIAHIELPLGNGTVLMGTDVVGSLCTNLTVGNNVYVMLEPESEKEADRLFNALSAGGRVEMPLQRTEWAEKYGCCADRFGVQWMVNYTGSVKFSLGQAS
jgi:PhnB protein